ncbi:hypothetical protein Slala04_12180 [Streptomyces lavendulae subsp. lavendulae]|nr:hypothetical protein [Streptomyces sp. XY511]KOU99239.1 hypothetical protein ADK91_28185 [Streptomyces sp. XY511]GLV89764.1 hypothetical protein Slala04_12180 [Streptomyces lavendulae subsp. lavendulae]
MGRTAVAVAAAGCGLVMVATASCAMPPAPPMSPGAQPATAAPSYAPSSSPSPEPPSPSVPAPASPSFSPTPPPPPEPPSQSGPAEPVGDGKVTAADLPLLAAVRRASAAAVPDDGAVIVINRGPEGAGELAWMPDDRTYCLAVIREARAETSCKPLPKSWARIGIRLVTKGAATGAGTVFFAVVDGGHGPYAYQGATAPGPGTGPIHDATAAFAAGRTLSLLTYERPAGAGTPGDQYICSADNAICFPALDAYVG